MKLLKTEKHCIACLRPFILIFFFSLSFFTLLGCKEFNNPVDPAADSYQGYEATRITDELLNSVFVSSVAGDDAVGKGTYDSPFATIQQGLAHAAAEGFPAVRVAEGYYPVDGAGFPEIVLVEGISLYGGYSYPDWFNDPKVFVTEVIDERANGGTVVTPNRCFYAGGGITGKTQIQGFHIFGSGDFSAGIFCDISGSPSIKHNYIDGGINTAATETYGIVIKEAVPLVEENILIGGHGDVTMAVNIFGLPNPVIRNNVLFGGEAVSAAYGIYCFQTDKPLIEGNEIDGGFTGTTCGVWLENSSPDIRNNRIFGGRATTGVSTGIYNFSSSFPTIEYNEISGGEGPTVYGIRCETSGNGVIRKNQLEGGIGNTAAGIYAANSSPELEGNTILGGPEGDTLTGVFLIGSSPRITGNSIFSGVATGTGIAVQCTDGSSAIVINNIVSGEESDVTSGGLFCSDSSPIVRNNIIYGGVAPTSYAVNLLSPVTASSPFIDNNIIIGGPSGIGINLDDAVSSAPSSIQHNDIFDCPNGLYSDPTNGVAFFISAMEAINSTNYYGNVSLDPIFANPAEGDVHLTSSTPIEVREGGLDGSVMGWSFNTDREGIVRTGNGSTGWSMGPYEYD